MKRTGWASSILRIILVLLLAGVGAVQAQSLRIDAVQWLRAAPESIPPDNAAWLPVHLPLRWNDSSTEGLKTAWYRAEFDAPQLAGGGAAVYLRRHYCATTVYINGTQIGSLAPRNLGDYVRWFRPHLYPFPASLLNARGNTLHIRAQCRDSDNDLGKILVGPESELRARYESRYFWQITTAQIGTILGIASGVLMIGLWWRRRQETIYGFFGLGALLWGIHVTQDWAEVHPLSLWTPLHAVYFAGTGGFTIAIILFMLRFGGRRWPRAEMFLYAYWLLGPAIVLLFGFNAKHWVDLLWLGGLLPVGAVGIALLGEAAFRLRSLPGYALFATGGLSLTFGFHDYLVHNGLLDTGLPFMLQMGVPLMLLAMAWLLAERFLGSLREVERLNTDLEARIRRKETELTENYSRLRFFEQQRAVAEERQRIMQDMHDGLGSQLLTSLSLVEAGSASPADVARTLRDSIDDMRLAIDALSPEESDLASALGNLRYRLLPRFAAAGINLDWDMTRLPDTPASSPGIALQVLRIVQEALANVLKHSQASHVVVSAFPAVAPGDLTISIADDGKGFDVNGRARGRGVSGMVQRAKKIGARLDISSGADGTNISLDIDLCAEAHGRPC